VFAVSRTEGLTKYDIAGQIGVHPSENDQLAFGLMVLSMTETTGESGPRSGKVPRLRLVK
jgi:hypothetical protein